MVGQFQGPFWLLDIAFFVHSQCFGVLWLFIFYWPEVRVLLHIALLPTHWAKLHQRTTPARLKSGGAKVRGDKNDRLKIENIERITTRLSPWPFPFVPFPNIARTGRIRKGFPSPKFVAIGAAWTP